MLRGGRLIIPSRGGLAALSDATRGIVPAAAALGLARARDDGRVSVLYAGSTGIGEFVLAESDLPVALRPSTTGRSEMSAVDLDANRLGALEWQLRLGGVTHVWSAASLASGVPARFWLGSTDATPLTGDQLERFDTLAHTDVAALCAPPSDGEAVATLRRLEAGAALLPALLQVLDIRDIFDQLSRIANNALPHDLLFLRRFSDDFSQITLFARSGEHTQQVAPVLPHLYPPAVTHSWTFDIIDDLRTHPLECDRPPARMGVRSALRLPIRIGDRMVGGIGFMSYATNAYASDDVIVGRRLADHVAVALSHQHLAEQARQSEELRARASKSDLLDEVLASLLTDRGALPEVFERVSSATQKVLAHDALILTVVLPNGREAKVYASQTPATTRFPDVVDVPPLMRANPDWEFDVVDNLQAQADQQHLTATQQGYRSALRVPIRLDDEYVAGLSFLAFEPGRYRTDDVPVARRIADRVALAFARERGAALLKRADEATARASRLESRVQALTDELDERTGYRRVVGESAQWRRVLTQATQVAPTDTTALLLGESGTGKEVVARFLHRASGRARGPFIALNCAALPEQLLEAELFGYERGAYTGATQSKPGQLEQASGGTLFLDEVGEMSPSAQAKFLRVLQEREFQRLGGTRVLRTDARIVAATNRDLRKAIAHGQFREDLYYRLNVFAIHLPPLRDRRDDILPLSDAFLAEIARGLGRPPAGISRDARQLLTEYPWPGNVRELRNTLERAAILCDGGLITKEQLSLRPVTVPPSTVPIEHDAATASASASRMAFAAAGSAAFARPSSAEELRTMERSMIEQALRQARFNKSKAAKALGLTRQQLYVRMRKYSLE